MERKKEREERLSMKRFSNTTKRQQQKPLGDGKNAVLSEMNDRRSNREGHSGTKVAEGHSQHRSKQKTVEVIIPADSDDEVDEFVSAVLSVDSEGLVHLEKHNEMPCHVFIPSLTEDRNGDLCVHDIDNKARSTWMQGVDIVNIIKVAAEAASFADAKGGNDMTSSKTNAPASKFSGQLDVSDPLTSEQRHPPTSGDAGHLIDGNTSLPSNLRCPQIDRADRKPTVRNKGNSLNVTADNDLNKFNACEQNLCYSRKTRDPSNQSTKSNIKFDSPCKLQSLYNNMDSSEHDCKSVVQSRDIMPGSPVAKSQNSPKLSNEAVLSTKVTKHVSQRVRQGFEVSQQQRTEKGEKEKSQSAIVNSRTQDEDCRSLHPKDRSVQISSSGQVSRANIAEQSALSYANAVRTCKMHSPGSSKTDKEQVIGPAVEQKIAKNSKKEKTPGLSAKTKALGVERKTKDERKPNLPNLKKETNETKTSAVVDKKATHSKKTSSKDTSSNIKNAERKSEISRETDTLSRHLQGLTLQTPSTCLKQEESSRSSSTCSLSARFSQLQINKRVAENEDEEILSCLRQNTSWMAMYTIAGIRTKEFDRVAADKPPDETSDDTLNDSDRFESLFEYNNTATIDVEPSLEVPKFSDTPSEWMGKYSLSCRLSSESKQQPGQEIKDVSPEEKVKTLAEKFENESVLKISSKKQDGLKTKTSGRQHALMLVGESADTKKGARNNSPLPIEETMEQTAAANPILSPARFCPKPLEEKRVTDDSSPSEVVHDSVIPSGSVQQAVEETPETDEETPESVVNGEWLSKYSLFPGAKISNAEPDCQITQDYELLDNMSRIVAENVDSQDDLMLGIEKIAYNQGQEVNESDYTSLSGLWKDLPLENNMGCDLLKNSIQKQTIADILTQAGFSASGILRKLDSDLDIVSNQSHTNRNMPEKGNDSKEQSLHFHLTEELHFNENDYYDPNRFWDFDSDCPTGSSTQEIEFGTVNEILQSNCYAEGVSWMPLDLQMSSTEFGKAPASGEAKLDLPSKGCFKRTDCHNISLDTTKSADTLEKSLATGKVPVGDRSFSDPTFSDAVDEEVFGALKTLNHEGKGSDRLHQLGEGSGTLKVSPLKFETTSGNQNVINLSAEQSEDCLAAQTQKDMHASPFTVNSPKFDGLSSGQSCTGNVLTGMNEFGQESTKHFLDQKTDLTKTKNVHQRFEHNSVNARTVKTMTEDRQKAVDDKSDLQWMGTSAINDFTKRSCRVSKDEIQGYLSEEFVSESRMAGSNPLKKLSNPPEWNETDLPPTDFLAFSQPSLCELFVLEKTPSVSPFREDWDAELEEERLLQELKDSTGNVTNDEWSCAAESLSKDEINPVEVFIKTMKSLSQCDEYHRMENYIAASVELTDTCETVDWPLTKEEAVAKKIAEYSNLSFNHISGLAYPPCNSQDSEFQGTWESDESLSVWAGSSTDDTYANVNNCQATTSREMQPQETEDWDCELQNNSVDARLFTPAGSSADKTVVDINNCPAKSSYEILETEDWDRELQNDSVDTRLSAPAGSSNNACVNINNCQAKSSYETQVVETEDWDHELQNDGTDTRLSAPAGSSADKTVVNINNCPAMSSYEVLVMEDWDRELQNDKAVDQYTKQEEAGPILKHPDYVPHRSPSKTPLPPDSESESDSESDSELEDYDDDQPDLKPTGSCHAASPVKNRMKGSAFREDDGTDSDNESLRDFETWDGAPGTSNNTFARMGEAAETEDCDIELEKENNEKNALMAIETRITRLEYGHKKLKIVEEMEAVVDMLKQSSILNGKELTLGDMETTVENKVKEKLDNEWMFGSSRTVEINKMNGDVIPLHVDINTNRWGRALRLFMDKVDQGQYSIIGDMTICDCPELYIRVSDIGEVGMFGVHHTRKALLVKKLAPSIGEKFQLSAELMPPLLQQRNVLPYLMLEEDYHGRYIYIASELCETNLMEYIHTMHEFDVYSRRRLQNRACKDIARGLRYLHSFGIVHGRLKPSNVLVKYDNTVVLCDYGLVESRNDVLGYLAEGNFQCWRPTEYVENYCLDSGFRADIQVAGMLLFYVWTLGDHPYRHGDLNIQMNIVNGWRSTRTLEPGQNSLVMSMLNNVASVRPSADQVYNHVVFWSFDRKFDFVMLVFSEYLSPAEAQKSCADLYLRIDSLQLNLPVSSHGLATWHILIPKELLEETSRMSGVLYGPSVTHLIFFMNHVTAFLPNMASEHAILVGNPHMFFMARFFTLPECIHCILRDDELRHLTRTRKPNVNNHLWYTQAPLAVEH